MLGGWGRTLLSVLVSDAFKTALVFFVIAFGLSILARSPTSPFSFSLTSSGDCDGSLNQLQPNRRDYYRLARGRLIRIFKKCLSKLPSVLLGGRQARGAETGVPMDFSTGGSKAKGGTITSTTTKGWGVATLTSKTRLESLPAARSNLR